MAHVPGMFPRKKFEIWVPEMQFQFVTFWRIPLIIKYIKDMIFYDLKNVPFPRHLFSEINNWKSHLEKLEGGGVRVTLRKPKPKFNIDVDNG